MPLPPVSRPMGDQDECCMLTENRISLFDNVDPTNHLGYKCKVCQKQWWFDEDLIGNEYVRNGVLMTSTEFGTKWMAAIDHVIRSGAHLDLNNVVTVMRGDQLVPSGKHDPWDAPMQEIWKKHS